MEELVLSRKRLKEMYETMKTKDIIIELAISRARLYKLLDDSGIPRKWDKAAKRPPRKITIID